MKGMEWIRICNIHARWSCQACFEHVYLYAGNEKMLAEAARVCFANPVPVEWVPELRRH